jgi:hypothetical protein
VTRRPADHQQPDSEGVIEEISLQPFNVATTWKDRAVVAVAVVALASGVLLAASNAIGLTEDAPPATQAVKPMTVPSVAPWEQTAANHRDDMGGVFRYYCPPGGTAADVFGDTVYALDSSICTAAVHRGLVAEETGGRVSIQISPGAARLPGETSHGIETHPTGPVDVTFVFVIGDDRG